MKTIANLLAVATLAAVIATPSWAKKEESMKNMPMQDKAMMENPMEEGMAMPKMPEPTEQHEWMQQLVGEWKATTKAMMPGKEEPIESTGTEVVKAVGPFWTVAEIDGTMMNEPFNGQMTLGYDAEEDKYISTWVDSISGKMWEYEGTLDESGKKLTLKTEGFCPMAGKNTEFRDTLEMVDANHKRYTMQMKNEDGEWVTTMTSDAVRVK